MKIRFGPSNHTSDIRLNQCAACLRVFGGMRAFDMHRIDFQCQDPAGRGMVVSRRALFDTSAGRIPFDIWSRQLAAGASTHFQQADLAAA